MSVSMPCVNGNCNGVNNGNTSADPTPPNEPPVTGITIQDYDVYIKNKPDASLGTSNVKKFLKRRVFQSAAAKQCIQDAIRSANGNGNAKLDTRREAKDAFFCYQRKVDWDLNASLELYSFFAAKGFSGFASEWGDVFFTSLLAGDKNGNGTIDDRDEAWLAAQKVFFGNENAEASRILITALEKRLKLEPLFLAGDPRLAEYERSTVEKDNYEWMTRMGDLYLASALRDPRPKIRAAAAVVVAKLAIDSSTENRARRNCGGERLSDELIGPLLENLGLRTEIGKYVGANQAKEALRFLRCGSAAFPLIPILAKAAANPPNGDRFYQANALSALASVIEVEIFSFGRQRDWVPPDDVLKVFHDNIGNIERGDEGAVSFLSDELIAGRGFDVAKAALQGTDQNKKRGAVLALKLFSWAKPGQMPEEMIDPTILMLDDDFAVPGIEGETIAKAAAFVLTRAGSTSVPFLEKTKGGSESKKSERAAEILAKIKGQMRR